MKGQREFKIINPAKFSHSYQEFINGKQEFAEISSKDFMIPQFDVEPIAGFVAPEHFPNCCQVHKNIYQQALEKFNDFPNCCDAHKPIAQQGWFDKSEYMYLPMKIVTTITYTMDCIGRSISNVDWYKEITHYIKETIDSYGQFPHGFGSPLGVSQYVSCIEANVIDDTEIPTEKKEKIIAYFRSLEKDGGKKTAPDLQKLISIYREWVRIFPFEISYLSHLKPRLQNLLPIFCGPIETNIYSGISSSKMATKEDVIKFVTDLTAYIIKELNAVEAFKKGLIKSTAKTQIELLNAKHKIALERLTFTGSENERAYIKTLKKWLKSERSYLSSLGELLKADYSNEAFALNMIDGIRLLQAGDTNQDCITTIRNKGKDKEAKVRNWFKDFLFARYKDSVVTAEEQNGNGRMDLKIYHQMLGTKVLEFKGWWNQGKGRTSEQIISYLTDFEGEGFIVIINHLVQKDIKKPYRSLVEDPKTGFQDGTWKEYAVKNAPISYFSSTHKIGIQEKTIFHFIFNVNF